MSYSRKLTGPAWMRDLGAQRLVKLDGWAEPDGSEYKTVTEPHSISERSVATQEKKAKSFVQHCS